MDKSYENFTKTELVKALSERDYAIEALQIELRELKRMIFGVRSERFVPEVNPQQSEFDLGLAQPEKPEIKTERITYNRRKKTDKKPAGHGRMPLPAHLPRKVKLIEPDCDLTGFKKIDEEITEELEYEPPSFYVNQYIRPKYAKPDGEGVVIGVLPSRPIEKGRPGPGLLAHIILSKCVDHLPLYRQRQQYLRQDVNLAVSTLSGWFAAGCEVLLPLFELHRDRVLRTDYLQVDETPIRVLDRTRKGRTHRGYLWDYYDPLGKQVLFDYRENHSREGPLCLLQDFQGTIQIDGYKVYDIFDQRADITVLNCMAHARRGFEKALGNYRQQAQYALTEIGKTYQVEREARQQGLSHAERRELRLEKARPVLEDFERWMKAQLVVPDFRPKSQIGKAISYALARWPALTRYLDDGRYEIDNNPIENSIRPIALGRKNYLFAGSHEGARRLALVYSFTATAKLYGIDPFVWLKDVFARIADHPFKELKVLLPENWQPIATTTSQTQD